MVVFQTLQRILSSVAKMLCICPFSGSMNPYILCFQFVKIPPIRYTTEITEKEPAYLVTLLELFISFGSNRIVQSVSSICGIIGFALTVLVTIRTSKISKILKYNATTSQYNKERTAFQKAFEGHRDSITMDGVRSEKLLKDIRVSLETWRLFAFCNTNLYHRNNMFHGIPAILLQPFVNNAHQTMNIKRHHIFLIRR